MAKIFTKIDKFGVIFLILIGAFLLLGFEPNLPIWGKAQTVCKDGYCIDYTTQTLGNMMAYPNSGTELFFEPLVFLFPIISLIIVIIMGYYMVKSFKDYFKLINILSYVALILYLLAELFALIFMVDTIYGTLIFTFYIIACVLSLIYLAIKITSSIQNKKLNVEKKMED